MDLTQCKLTQKNNRCKLLNEMHDDFDGSSNFLQTLATQKMRKKHLKSIYLAKRVIKFSLYDCGQHRFIIYRYFRSFKSTNMKLKRFRFKVRQLNGYMRADERLRKRLGYGPRSGIQERGQIQRAKTKLHGDT